MTPKGNLVVNFTNESQRNDAAKLIEEKVSDTEAKIVKKLRPKIMICNVNKMEEDVLSELIERNVFLRSIPDIEKKIEFIFHKEAAGNTNHYIFRCDPDVRKIIKDHNNKVQLRWANYDVRDRYHVMTCYRCQRFGHRADRCRSNIEDTVCGRCAENHKTKDCTSNTFKCINCVRAKHQDVGHRVNTRACKSLENQLLQVALITDHGY